MLIQHVLSGNTLFILLVFRENFTKYLEVLGFSTGPPGGLHKTSSSPCLFTGFPRRLHLISTNPWLFYWSAGRTAQNIFKSLSFNWCSQRTAPNIYKCLVFLLVRQEDCTKLLQVRVFSGFPRELLQISRIPWLFYCSPWRVAQSSEVYSGYLEAYIQTKITML